VTSFDLNKLQESLSGCMIGHGINLLPEVDSTNVYANRLAQKGASEGVVVIADTQTSGKGRLNRVWQSPPHRNLYTSIILRPDIALGDAPRITLAAGISVAEAILEYCSQGVALKWPNDVLINDKKICGILTEMKTYGEKPAFVIVGIGVNINMRVGEFAEDIRNQATSLYEETGRETDRSDFVIRMLGKFEHWYRIFLAGNYEEIRASWLKYSNMIGKQVQVCFRDKIENGKVIGMDEKGALLIVDDLNRVKEILAGDVSLRANF
jgi:BirA family biotin operon repressor/biotin-[acetyl-CoA-carboxylase] ligase